MCLWKLKGIFFKRVIFTWRYNKAANLTKLLKSTINSKLFKLNLFFALPLQRLAFTLFKKVFHHHLLHGFSHISGRCVSWLINNMKVCSEATRAESDSSDCAEERMVKGTLWDILDDSVAELLPHTHVHQGPHQQLVSSKDHASQPDGLWSQMSCTIHGMPPHWSNWPSSEQ